MKYVAVALIMLVAGCSGPYAATGMGTSEGDATIGLGKVINRQAEVGVGVEAIAVEDDHATYIVDLYYAWLPQIDALQGEWQPFLGVKVGTVAEGGDFAMSPGWFSGMVMNPHNTLSLVGGIKQQFPGGDTNSPDVLNQEEEILGTFGFRFRTDGEEMNSAALARREAEIRAKHGG